MSAFLFLNTIGSGRKPSSSSKPTHSNRPLKRKPNKLSQQSNSTTVAANSAETQGNDKCAALIIGVEYTAYAAKGYMQRLPGCHNDANTMQSLMKDIFHVPSKNMLVLMDDGSHQSPTKVAIERGLAWLANKATGENGCTQLWISYSGHGSYLTDTNGDEPDGNDEVLVPADCYDAGYITDDYMKQYATQLVPSSAALNCCFDCCHSASIFDLPYAFTSADGAVKQIVSSNNQWIDGNGTTVPSLLSSNSSSSSSNSSSSSIRMGCLQPLCLSACADNQTSVSAYNLNKRREWQGALTYAFNFVVRQKWQEQLSTAATAGSSFSITAADLINRVGRLVSAKGYDQTTVLGMAIKTDDAASIMFPASL